MVTNNAVGMGHAISVLNDALVSAKSERERIAGVLGRFRSEFQTERDLRTRAEAEVARLQNLVDSLSSEVSLLRDANTCLEREARVMASAIEIAGDEIRANERKVAGILGHIANELPLTGEVSPDAETDEYAAADRPAETREPVARGNVSATSGSEPIHSLISDLEQTLAEARSTRTSCRQAAAGSQFDSSSPSQ